MQAKAKEYGERIIEAFLSGNDQTILDIHRELCLDYELYLDTWSLFPSGMRRSLKELISRDLREQNGEGIEVPGGN